MTPTPGDREAWEKGDTMTHEEAFEAWSESIPNGIEAKEHHPEALFIAGRQSMAREAADWHREAEKKACEEGKTMESGSNALSRTLGAEFSHQDSAAHFTALAGTGEGEHG